MARLIFIYKSDKIAFVTLLPTAVNENPLPVAAEGGEYGKTEGENKEGILCCIGAYPIF